MVKVVIIAVPEGAELADEANESPYIYKTEFPSMQAVLNWFEDSVVHKDPFDLEVPVRMHPIGEDC